jgi:hypothetical protein
MNIFDKDSDGQIKLKLEAFASKTVRHNGVSKRLYKRIHGKKFTCVTACTTTDLDFVVPYPDAKIETIEIIGGELGDSLDFEVYDTPCGDISGYPCVKLNQFGFSVYMDATGYYEQHSQYDADVIQNMKFKIKYTNANPTKTVYINFVLNEVKE